MESTTNVQMSSFDVDILRISVALTSLIEDTFNDLDRFSTLALVTVIASLFGPQYVPHVGYAHVLVSKGMSETEIEFSHCTFHHAWIVHAPTKNIVDVRHPCSTTCAVTVYDEIKPVYIGTKFAGSSVSREMLWLKRGVTKRIPKKGLYTK